MFYSITTLLKTQLSFNRSPGKISLLLLDLGFKTSFKQQQYSFWYWLPLTFCIAQSTCHCMPWNSLIDDGLMEKWVALPVLSSGRSTPSPPWWVLQWWLSAGVLQNVILTTIKKLSSIYKRLIFAVWTSNPHKRCFLIIWPNLFENWKMSTMAAGAVMGTLTYSSCIVLPTAIGVNH